MKRSLIFAGLSLTLASLPVALLSGCGGANNPGAFVGTTGTTGGTTTSPFASRSYNTSIALGSTRDGALALQVGADGTTVTGTLTVMAASRAIVTRQTQSFSFGVGTYSIRGTINASGQFQMTGGSGADAFTLNGTLPTQTSDGAYTLTAGGETYSALLPATGAAASPTPVATATPAPSGSGAVQFQVINRSADCNLDESLISGLAIKQAKYTPASAVAVPGYNAYGLSFTADKKVGDDSGTFAILYAYTGAGTIVPQTFTFKPEIDIFDAFVVPAGVGVTTSDVNVNGTNFSIVINQWRPSGGSLIIESVSGKTIVVRGENVTFAPLSGPNLSSKGTFTANFTVTLTNVDGL